MHKTFRRLCILLGYSTLGWTYIPAAYGVVKTGEIRVFGNEDIKTYIILREIKLRTGDSFDATRVAAAKERIRRIPGVDYSDIRTSFNPDDSTMALSVIVTEKSSLEGYPVIRRGYQDEMSFGLRAVNSNFRGRSERLWSSFVVRGNRIFTAGWENPWIGAGQRRIGIGLCAHFKDYDYVYDDNGEVFRDAEIRRSGVEFSVFQTFTDRMRISLALGFENVESGRSGVTLEPGGDGYLTASVGFDYDARDSDRFPWSGVRARATGREIGPGDDAYSIHEGQIDAGAYMSILSRTVLALGARLNYRDGDEIPLYRREHLGGSGTLRGREFGSFHGTKSILFGAEYRVPWNFSRAEPVADVLLGISTHLFADAGVAWENDGDLDTEIFHGTFGVGILILNGSVPGLRIDYGWHQHSNGRWEIDIGAKF
jgi:outer membrane protein insertion porin family